MGHIENTSISVFLHSTRTFKKITDRRCQSGEVFYSVIVTGQSLNCFSCHGRQHKANNTLCSQPEKRKSSNCIEAISNASDTNILDLRVIIMHRLLFTCRSMHSIFLVLF